VSYDYEAQDAAERAAVRDMDPKPHFELNDGSCVGCGSLWPCAHAWDRYNIQTEQQGF
jgi:hypothetical protein